MHSRNPEIIRYAELIHRTPSALAMKLTNFASLDPKITASGRKGLSAVSRSDRAIWEEMTSNWPRFAEETVNVQSSFGERQPRDPDLGGDPEDFVGRTRSTIVEARIGQTFFRNAVLSAYEFRCCITGLSIPELLVASHIIPWRDDRANRLNPRNGLCLSAAHDRAFDLGFIAVSNDLRMLLSTPLRKMKSDAYVNNTFCFYEGQPISIPKKFNPDLGFLKYHRDKLFRG
jgi:predicted restriction endonuclease